MTPRLKKLLIVLLLVVGAIAAFAFISPYSPLSYYTANPQSYEECMKAHGTYENIKGINTCSFKNKVFSEHAINGSLKTFTDNEYGFSLKYPGNIFREHDTAPVVHFLGGKEYDSTSLVHTVDAEHCDLSGLPGSCTPQTTDISIGITPLNQSYSSVSTAALEYFGELEDEKWGNTSAKSFRAGAEGEGIYYYLIDLGNNKSLLITRSFIDENILISYKSENDFIKYERQKQIFDEIMTSFKLITNN